ncbi:MAG: hypothetical protein ABI847_12095 [Anaerolineales bacterium]
MLNGPEGSRPVRSRRLALARAAFLLPASVAIGLLALLAPINRLTAQFDWRFELTYPVVAPFLSVAGYAFYWMSLQYAVALICVLVGVFIAWRKADDPVAWLAGVVLVSVPLSFGLGGYSDTWSYYPRPWREIFRGAREVVAFGNAAALMLFVFLFPNGRLPLRWMRWVAIAYTALLAALAIIVVARPGLASVADWVYLTWLLAFLTALPLALAGQFYRYRRLSTPTERQQTKWVVVGFTSLLVGFVLTIAVQLATESTPQAGILQLLMSHLQLLTLLVVPLALAFSILRYRLWDIDRLVQRTLLYAAITGTLAALYLGSVIVLQSGLKAVTGRAQSPVVTVISTLIIAALAGPLRRRLQNMIDRRFNRRRYDAARTLQAFSSAMRDNSVADLQRLNNQLVGIVQDTLEPEKVSLWLRS